MHTHSISSTSVTNETRTFRRTSPATRDRRATSRGRVPYCKETQDAHLHTGKPEEAGASIMSTGLMFTGAVVSWPWSKPPPPPPPPSPPLLERAAPVLLAVAMGWIMPTVLFLWMTRGQSGSAKSAVAESATKSSADAATTSAADKKQKKTHPGIFLGSLSCFMAISSAAITFPFMQTRRDALGCDALCQGGQTSLRSGLGLVGASIIGRASDTFGRVPMMWVGIIASLAGLGINFTMDSIEGMWLSLVPAALLNQNFAVAKALFSDYIDEIGGTDADRAGAVGKLGMAVGFAFMFGPIIATLFVSDYLQALQASAVGTALAAVVLLWLPTPGSSAADKAPSSSDGAVRPTPPTNDAVQPVQPGASAPSASAPASSSGGLMSFLDLPVLKTRGAQLLMAVRLLMAFAFHMFAPIWQVSIKKRFDFAPKDHAQFMGLVGLTYALSQGLVAKPMIRRAGKDPTPLLLLCIVLLGAARPFALLTSSVGVVYVLYVPMVIALGVMNTAITTACSGLASGDQLGGLFGVLESVESVAGILGPAVGGMLSRAGAYGALGAVVTCYSIAFVLVALYFNKHVIAAGKAHLKTA